MRLVGGGGGLNEGSQCAFGCSIRHMTLQLLRSHCCHWIYCCCVLFVVVLVALCVCMGEQGLLWHVLLLYMCEYALSLAPPLFIWDNTLNVRQSGRWRFTTTLQMPYALLLYSYYSSSTRL